MDGMQLVNLQNAISVRIVDQKNLVDRPTQLIHIGISICQHTRTKDIAGQSAKALESLLQIGLAA